MSGWSLNFAPLLPQAFLLALAVLLIAALTYGIFRRQKSVLWRGLAGAALLLILTNPTLQRELRDALPSVAVIVVDDSASQSIGNRREQTEATSQALQAQLKTLPNITVRMVRAGASVTPDSEGTELFDPLLQTLSDVPSERIAGVFMITDGQVHDIPESPAALPFKAPLHALITGKKAERDRRIVLIDAPRFALLNSTPKIHFRVDDPNADDQVDVLVKLNGVITGKISVKTGETVEQEIEIKTAGENVVELSVDRAPDELTALNNRAAVGIKGMRENLRVLLISGEPHAGERTWRNLLKSDAAVDLVHFTILRPPDKVDSTPIRELSLIAFPVRELFQDKISDFDLIIFDRYERRNILPMIYFDNMANYVRNGGAILVVSGPEDAGVDSVYQTALSEVLPIEPTGALTEKAYLPRLSDRGMRHPVTRGLPGSVSEGDPHWSHWFRAVNVAVHDGETLMTGPDKLPLLVLGRAGEGRVATLLSDQVWLWARNFEGGGPHTDLLRRVVHWLMKEPELDEESLRARQNGNSILIERQSMEAGGTAVQVQRPDGAVESLRLSEAQAGLWRGITSATLPGLYRVTQGDKTALLAVGPPNPEEFIDARSTPEKFKPLAEATGGASKRLDETGTLAVPKLRLVNAGDKAFGPGWLGLYQRNVTDLKGVETFPLLQTLLGLMLALGLTAFGWYREGR